MHQYDECVEHIKSENDIKEALEWLEEAGKKYGVIHELSHEESIEVVEEAYNRGAVRVEVLGILSDDPSESSVDMLLITLPKDRHSRQLLFDLEETIGEMSGYERSVDEGQDFVLLRW
jgi:hypothetical protein